MLTKKQISDYRKVYEILKKRGRTKTDIMKESGITFSLFKLILEKDDPKQIPLRASSLGKIQDFIKRYAEDLLLPPMEELEDEPEPEEQEKPVESYRPEPEPVSERRTKFELEKKLRSNRENLTHEFLKKITDLCEEKPPHIEVQLIIK